jgi:predicted PurR-regulated permease PerM
MAEDLARATWLRRVVVAAVLAGLALLAFQVVSPFIVPVIWAVIIAFVTWPAHEWLARRLRRRTLSALLMTVMIALAIVLPLVYLALLAQSELTTLYREFTVLLGRGPRIPDWLLQVPVIGAWLGDLVARLAEDPKALDTELLAFLERSSLELGGVAGGVGRNIVKLITAMLSLFFMYRDGQRVATEVSAVLRQIFGSNADHYVVAVGQTIKAVVYGLVLAALAQGTLAGIGYYFAGLPAPLFLGAVTTLVAMIPFGPPFIWVTASSWLLLSGQPGAAVGLFIWGATAVSWIDNFVRPLVISGAAKIPFLLVLFGVLGGIAAFGLVGLFIGPVILAVVIAIWREWVAEKKEEAGA